MHIKRKPCGPTFSPLLFFDAHWPELTPLPPPKKPNIANIVSLPEVGLRPIKERGVFQAAGIPSPQAFLNGYYVNENAMC